MSIIKKLTYCHLKKNMKRTILTLCGIIVSVAMVTAVFTSSISLMNFFKETSDMYGGTWYAKYYDCSFGDIDKLTALDDVDKVAAQAQTHHVDMNFNNKSNRYETDMSAVNSQYYETFHIDIKTGTYPKNGNEILVTQAFLDNNKLDWKVGDTVTFSAMSYESYTDDAGEDAYTDTSAKVVGITDTKNQTTDFNGIFTAMKNKTEYRGMTLYVKNVNLNNSIWDDIKNDAKAIGRESADGKNGELLMYSGIFKDNAMLFSLGGFAGIILIIIMIASVFMIYDSFAVSYQQRAKYLGMLASVGATKSQKRSSIYYEGFILGAVGIPLGIISGIGGIAVTFKAISGLFKDTFNVPIDQTLSVHINPFVIIGSVLISALTILISAYIPAHRASKTTAIDAIRQNNTVKVKSKRLKTSKLSSKLFGYEGSLASKNFKRNGKRSRSIVLALTISVVLFLTVTNFSSLFTNMINMEYQTSQADLFLFVDLKDDKKFNDKISTMSNVEKYYGTLSIFVSLENSEQYLSEDGIKYKSDYVMSDMIISAVDDELFNEYAKYAGFNPDEYYNKSDAKAIIYNSKVLSNADDKKRLSIEPLTDKINNQTINCLYTKIDDNSEKETKIPVKFTVDGITTKNPKNFSVSPVNICAIIPRSMSEQFVKSPDEAIHYSINASAHDDVYNELETYFGDNDMTFSGYDQTSQMQSMTAINTIAKVFGYGFITLISLISIMNIINTIATSMEERRREFAMLKSVGLTPGSFNKMIYLESISYGVKSLLWGIPISLILNIFMYKMMASSMDYGFKIGWLYIAIAIVAVFAVIGISLIYSTTKIKHDNIIETIKSDDA